MKLSVGIVGLPNVGKSTLFKILTKQDVTIAEYPFATVDPNVGIVPVPDERLEKIAKLVDPDKVVPAVIEFYDIAGLVKGAHKGEGLGNQFLAKIREVSVIAHLARCFQAENVAHTEAVVDPMADIDTVHQELILSDLEAVERKLEKSRKDAKADSKERLKKVSVLEELQRALKGNLLASSLPSGIRSEQITKEFFLLTMKPQIYVLNGAKEEVSGELIKKIEELGSEYVAGDLAEVESLDELVEKTYKALGLVTFYTITGGREVRAWAIRRGTSAHDAAGDVHTDFKEKFIKADVINWERLLDAGGWQEARQKGWIRTEGKDYVVADGDVIEVKHS